MGNALPNLGFLVLLFGLPNEIRLARSPGRPIRGSSATGKAAAGTFRGFDSRRLHLT